MTDPKPTKLDKLLQKQRQLAAEIAAINAREKSEERKRDTRRKILIGGAVLASYRHGDFSKDQLFSLLDTFLEYDRDRALFDFLPPAAGSGPKAAAQSLEPETASQANFLGTDDTEPGTSTSTELRKRPVHNPSPDMKDFV